MPTPIEVFREIVRRSSPYTFDCAAHSAMAYNKKWRETGERPPDYYLPGGLIRSLTPEQREILSKLTSEEVEKERP
jgi:hypothetical protein